MTAEINQKKLYYNHYTSGKFLILKFKFQVKYSEIPPPPHHHHPNFRCFATSLHADGILINKKKPRNLTFGLCF
jgi:hypothetical protein